MAHPSIDISTAQYSCLRSHSAFCPICIHKGPKTEQGRQVQGEDNSDPWPLPVTMKVQDVPAFLRQLKNYFPDSKLNDPDSGAASAVERQLAGRPDSEQITIEDFVHLLNVVERPAAPIPNDQGIYLTINLNAYGDLDVARSNQQIGELKSQVKELSEDNSSLRSQLDQCSQTEISLKRSIEDVLNINSVALLKVRLVGE